MTSQQRKPFERAGRIGMAHLSLVALLLALIACASSQAPRQQLRVPISAEPGTLDPTRQEYSWEAAVGRNTFEALTRARPDLSDVQGAAASSWKVSADGLTWTFTIRPDEKYSDGTAVTAGDFVYAYRRILDPTVGAPYADPYFDGTIDGAQGYPDVRPADAGAVTSFLNGLGLSAPDNSTFVVRLQHPTPYFKWVASLWIAAPLKKTEVDTVGSAHFGSVSASAASQIVGNGPFKISDVVPKDHITLVPNTYYRTRPVLQKLVLDEIGSDVGAYLAYENGELDMAAVPLAETEAVRNSQELLRIPELGTYWLDFNARKKPFDNANVRRAFSRAIDRQSFVNSVLRARGIPAITLIPKGMPGYRPDLGASQSFDVVRARQALMQSGMTPTELGTMNIAYLFNVNSSSSKQIAEFIQAQLQVNLGVTVLLEGADLHTIHVRRSAGNYMIYGLEGFTADYPDPQDFFDIFLTGSFGFYGGFSSLAYDSAVRTADATPYGPQRDRLYAEAEAILADEAPVAFLDQHIDWWLVKSYVKDMTYTQIDDFPGDFYISTLRIGHR